MVKIRFGINTSFALRRWTQPKQWMELIHSQLELDICELSLDLVDPNLREPVKTMYMQEILELGDDYPVEILSCRTGLDTHTKDMLLHPNFGFRIDAIQWLEKAIDIAAYTNATYFGGHFGGFVVQEHIREHKNLDLLTYTLSFLKDSMTYLSSVAYSAGLAGIFFEPFSIFSDIGENVKTNRRILYDLQNATEISLHISPIAQSHELIEWIPEFPKDTKIIQIHNIADAERVKEIMDRIEEDKIKRDTANVFLDWIPPFNLSINQALIQLKESVSAIKEIFKLT